MNTPDWFLIINRMYVSGYAEIIWKQFIIKQVKFPGQQPKHIDLLWKLYKYCKGVFQPNHHPNCYKPWRGKTQMDKVFIIMVNLIDVLTFPRNLIYYLIISLTSETVTVHLSIFILGWRVSEEGTGWKKMQKIDEKEKANVKKQSNQLPLLNFIQFPVIGVTASPTFNLVIYCKSSEVKASR